MANSFMIRFLFAGKPCFANVYVYDTTPKECHVHIVNSVMHHHLPENLLLIEKDEKLCLSEPLGIDNGLLTAIVQAIEEHMK